MILVITGPAGAGKSTTADLLASTVRQRSSRLSTDDIRDWVRSGYADPSEGWTPEVVQQVELARTIARDAALRYVENGYIAVDDDVVAPTEPRLTPDHWIVDGIETKFLVLLPSWAGLVRRNQTRSGFRLLLEEHLRAVFDTMQPWLEHDGGQEIIDNSEVGIHEAVDQVI